MLDENCSKEESKILHFVFTASLLLFIGTVQAAATVRTDLGSWAASGTLLGRDATGAAVSLLVGGTPNPNLKYVYDTVLDLTWLANWNVNGAMTWSTAKSWANNLDGDPGYIGTGWKLPDMPYSNSVGCDYVDGGNLGCNYHPFNSESDRMAWPLAHMFYDTLGNPGHCGSGVGSCAALAGGFDNSGPFSNVIPVFYWSGSELTGTMAGKPLAGGLRLDETSAGRPYFMAEDSNFHAVAVRPGDVLLAVSVPEPHTLALASLGLMIFGFARRRWS